MLKYEVDVYDDGSLHYYRHGELHRSTGPAVINSSSVMWRCYGFALTKDEVINFSVDRPLVMYRNLSMRALLHY